MFTYIDFFLFQIVPFIQKCHSGKDVPKDLIFQCIGIICVNAIGFSFDKSGKQGRALYATTVLGTIHKLRRKNNVFPCIVSVAKIQFIR